MWRRLTTPNDNTLILVGMITLHAKLCGKSKFAVIFCTALHCILSEHSCRHALPPNICVHDGALAEE